MAALRDHRASALEPCPADQDFVGRPQAGQAEEKSLTVGCHAIGPEGVLVEVKQWPRQCDRDGRNPPAANETAISWPERVR
jgi:hypothetical protein